MDNNSLITTKGKASSKNNVEVGGKEFDIGSSTLQQDSVAKAQKIPRENSLFASWYDFESPTMERIYMKEACFTKPKQPNRIMDSEWKNSADSEIKKILYSVFELPIFGWTEETKLKMKSLKNTRKFLFCFFFKICGFPLYIAYQCARLILVMLAAIWRTLKVLGPALLNTFILVINNTAGRIFFFNIPLVKRPYTEIDKDGTKKKRTDPWSPGPSDILISLFGMNLPYHKMISEEFGYNYGRGEIGLFIFIVMTISAILITVTGINVLVLGGVFFYFIFKTLFEIRKKAMGKDLREGGTSSD